MTIAILPGSVLHAESGVTTPWSDEEDLTSALSEVVRLSRTPRRGFDAAVACRNLAVYRVVLGDVKEKEALELLHSLDPVLPDMPLEQCVNSVVLSGSGAEQSATIASLSTEDYFLYHSAFKQAGLTPKTLDAYPAVVARRYGPGEVSEPVSIVEVRPECSTVVTIDQSGVRYGKVVTTGLTVMRAKLESDVPDFAGGALPASDASATLARAEAEAVLTQVFEPIARAIDEEPLPQGAVPRVRVVIAAHDLSDLLAIVASKTLGTPVDGFEVTS